MEETSPLQRALNLSTNRIVSACAGAGKTYALSKRYCAIIDEFTKYNLKKPKNDWLGFKNILVITFTNKAAAEMSRRIYEDLQVLLRDEEISDMKEQGISLGDTIRNAPEDYKNWLRSTFSQNYIMTIDAFCGSVLRENAYLLNIDPQFKTSDELLAQKLYRETLNEFFNRQSKALRPELKRILQYTDKSGIIQFFNYFNDRKVFLEEWLEFVENKSKNEIYRYWLDTYLPEFDVDLLVRKVKSIAQYHEHILDSEENNLAFLRAKLEHIPEDMEQERHRYFMAEVLPYFLTKKNEYYSESRFIQTKKSFINPDIYNGYRDAGNVILDELSQHIPQSKVLFFPAEEDIRSIEVFKDLITLYAEFEDALWQTQLRKNYLTFNDVIIKTRELLSEHENVRKQYSEQFKHILVDEFQDTNNLRWEIIKNIAKKADGTLRNKGLFIVGDKKQSIYRFQQADVEVMNVARDELEEVAPEALIAFNDNYRSSKRYIDHVINPLFRKIFTPSEHSFEASFEETSFPRNRKKDGIGSETVCDISIIEIDQNQQNYIPSKHAAYMAEKYLEWADEQQINEEVIVGVLLRNFIHIHEYLRAFQELGIPFQIIGERNLFNQQEAYDLFHFISVLINPHDDASLVGLLRSPFFCVSDTLIYNLKDRRLKKEKESILAYMSNKTEYYDIIQTIQHWRQLSQKLSVHALLHEVLSKKHRELGYVSEVGGRQRLANIDKLLHLISQLELEGISLQELHDYLAYQIRYKSEVAQADLPEPAKVQIMTIHKAKGLEFPTVIIPELNDTKTQSDKGNIYHSRINPEGMIEVGIAIKEQTESRKSNFLNLIKQQDKIEQEAEDKRMFYVAVTRAKYRIALLGEHTGTYNKKSWWSTFVATPLGLPQTFEDINAGEFLPPSHLAISCMSADELNDRLAREIDKEMKLTHWNPPTIPVHKDIYTRITPHDIMKSLDQADCPTFSNEGTDNVAALAFGTIFHTCIEKHWWRWDTHKSEIEKFVTTNFPALSFNEIQQILKIHLDHFSSSNLAKTIEQIDEKNLHHEHHVTGWMDNGKNFYEVNGIIDLLYKDVDGWKIVDFKTNQTAQFHEQYTLQLQTYQWIVRQLYAIDAKAYIYYSAFNELREIPFSSKYWSEIFPEEIHPFYPSKLRAAPINHDILEKINDEPITIINLTSLHAKQMIQSLAAIKRLTPNIEITTLNHLVISSSRKMITPSVCRMLVRKASEDYQLSDGMIELLAQAIIKYDLQEKEFKTLNKEFNKIYNNFEGLKKSHGFFFESEISENLLREKLSDKTIILKGFFRDSAKYFSFIKLLSEQTEKFYFIDSFKNDALTTSFNYTQQIWETIVPIINSEGICLSYYSVETEIEGIAQKIIELTNQNVSYHDIQLSISSIDVYVPVIKNVFTAYGISHRIHAPLPLIDNPLTDLITNILTIILSSEHLTWKTLSSILLHPLMPENEQFYKLDAFIRQKPITYFSDITELEHVDEFRDSIHAVCELIAELEIDHVNDLSDIWNIIEEFLQNRKIDPAIDKHIESKSAYTKIKNIINSTIDIYREIGFPEKPDDLLRDLKRQFKEAEMSRKRTGNGVEVISYLESYNTSTPVLFIAGLAEKYFPVPPKKNPFVKSLPHYEWQKSALLFNSWMQRKQHTHLSYPCQNMSGDTLNPSILLEGIKIINQQITTSSTRQTLRQYYLTCEDRIIENPILPVLQRHNDYLSEDIGPFKGQVEPDGSHTLLTSASSMNTLIQCPMQYLFQDILKIKPLEFDEDSEVRIALGINIHEALEKFGNVDGFTILKHNFEQACSLLNQQVKQVLQKNHIHLENDLFLQRLYAPYTEGLDEAHENNLLVTLLSFNKENFNDYTPLHFEQEFGMHKQTNQEPWSVLDIHNEIVTLNFWGKIDKILEKNDHSEIIGIDYKTGSTPQASDINEFWDVQPLIYYFILHKHYPDKQVKFIYESTKDQGKIPLTIDFGNNEMHIKTSRSEYILSEKDIIKILLHYGEKVLLGNFNIRERERNGKPCNYCLYYKLCRKNSMFNMYKDIINQIRFNKEKIS
ncbi:MAG: UvrD-helicase domain-containing protein [Candidatus Cloacimonetes bacterium]|nr:UvrD-helicase domain-containing protein [Candidatus Cloacimonadota bacterium]